MKQYITLSQLQELTDKGKENLYKWWKPAVGDCYLSSDGKIKFITEIPFKREGLDLPLLSIGQMIEFMDQRGKYVYSKQDRGDSYFYWTIRKRKEKQNKYVKKELSDCLWRAVKNELEGIAN